MRSSVFSLVFVALCSAASAQVTVPNTFSAGSPAKAADVNANFQALATAINAIGARVSKLEGKIAASDLVGTYAFNFFQTELRSKNEKKNSYEDSVSAYTSSGTAKFAADGTCSLSGFNLEGHELQFVRPNATTDLPTPQYPFPERIDTVLYPVNRSASSPNCTWSFSDGQVTALGGNFSVVAGGRLLIRTTANPADGTNIILLLTRTN